MTNAAAMREEVAPGIIFDWFGVSIEVTWGAAALVVGLLLAIVGLIVWVGRGWMNK